MARATSTTTSGEELRSYELLEYPLRGLRAASNNALHTNRFSWYSFVPLCLFEQFFYTPVNLYFLGIAVLQMIPSITVTGGFPSIIFPLSFVLVVAMMKDAVEDIRRYNSDWMENNWVTRRMVPHLEDDKIVSTLEEVKWEDCKVGDTIILKNYDLIPCDLMICATSNAAGLAYVDTANLDGETNLKVRNTSKKAISLTEKMVMDQQVSSTLVAEKWSQLRGVMTMEIPNGSLYTFQGTCGIETGDEKEELMELRRMLGRGSKQSKRTSDRASIPHDSVIPLDASNILLRGCKLRNTAWAVGKVLYTGKETKIQQQQTQKNKRKQTHMMRYTSKILVWVMILQFCLCLAFGIINAGMIKQDDNKTFYIGEDPESYFMTRVTKRFFSAVILLVTLVPISLSVTLSVAKFFQAALLKNDVHLEWKGHMCAPKSSDLNEELGQVAYVFTDKTGTLTQNLMEFRKCAVDGISYGKGITEIRRQVLKRGGQPIPEEPVAEEGAVVTPCVNFIDSDLVRDLNAKGKKREALTNFFLHLAINHTVLPEVLDDGRKVYSASSPDEGALVYGAQHFGFNFVERPDQEHAVIEIPGQDALNVEILATIEFTSDRKRSSVLARFHHPLLQKEVCYLFTKGADTMMTPILKKDVMNGKEGVKAVKYLEQYASEGLRTLMLGGKVVDNAESWLKEWEECQNAMSCREEKMATCANILECDLDLHGITGVEDRLQQGVGETIELLEAAGIKVWMLTGDKVETAINIAVATGLLEAFCKPEERPVFDWEEVVSQYGKTAIDHVLDKYKKLREAQAQGQEFEAIVMDGQCLRILLPLKDFYEFTCSVKSVLCCRVSPDQKGQIVRLFKKKSSGVTLAIGDGANDTNMIRSAHVGVGIRGEEGLQAFNVSDYGIGQFRFLADLILVYGRQYYRRNAGLVEYIFYKNMFLCWTQYLGNLLFWCSGTRLYPDTNYQFFNTCYTALPIFAFTMFDQDVTRRECFLYPHLYKLGLTHEYLNKKVIVSSMMTALWQGTLVYLIPFFTLRNDSLHEDGTMEDQTTQGLLMFHCVVILVHLRLVMMSYYLTWLSAFLFFNSFLVIAVLSPLMNYVPSFGLESFGAVTHILRAPQVYLLFTLTLSCCLAVEIVSRIYRYYIRPNEVEKIHRNIHGISELISPDKRDISKWSVGAEASPRSQGLESVMPTPAASAPVRRRTSLTSDEDYRVDIS